MKHQSIKHLVVLTVLFMPAANTCLAQAETQAQANTQTQTQPQAQPQTKPLAQPHAEWPRSITTADGNVIDLYQPRFLSCKEDTVRFSSVISVQNMSDNDPVFGVAWTTATVITDTTSHQLVIRSVRADRVRMADDADRGYRKFVTAAIALCYTQVIQRMPLNEVQASLALGEQEEALSADSGAPAPKIYFSPVRTALVLIDGEPKLEKNEHWGLDVVANSRNLIIKGTDSKYYLYGGMAWYVAPAATGPYAPLNGVFPQQLRKIRNDLRTAARKDWLWLDDSEVPVYKIIVSTEPAALIQSDGRPKFKSVPGTSLRHLKNSQDEVFIDRSTDRYYTRIGSQWYQSAGLSDSTAWQPVDNALLPADLLFTLSGKAPAGATSVAGGTTAEQKVAEDLAAEKTTAEKKEAVTAAMADEEVPQTAKIPRGTTTTVDYDGAPQFRPIVGTDLAYATNTCSIVFRYNGEYYALDNGVWFVAANPLGLWRVSDVRPVGLELIPRRYRVFRAKFVDIYQRGPDYVYEGYLPGYEDDPLDGCALTASYDYDWMDMAWGYDLDYLFGWGWGWYQGYFRFDQKNRTYGRMIYGGKHPGWHEKGSGPLVKIHGAGSANGVAAHGWKPGGLSHGVSAAGGWHGGNPGGGISRGGNSGGGASRGGFSGGGGASHGGVSGGGGISHSGGGGSVGGGGGGHVSSGGGGGGGGGAHH